MSETNNLMLIIMAAAFGALLMGALLYYAARGMWPYLSRGDVEEGEGEGGDSESFEAVASEYLTADERACYADYLAVIRERVGTGALRWIAVGDAGSRGVGILGIGDSEIWFARRMGSDIGVGWRCRREIAVAWLEGREAHIGKEGRARPAFRCALTGERRELCADMFGDAMADDAE